MTKERAKQEIADAQAICTQIEARARRALIDEATRREFIKVQCRPWRQVIAYCQAVLAAG